VGMLPCGITSAVLLFRKLVTCNNVQRLLSRARMGCGGTEERCRQAGRVGGVLLDMGFDIIFLILVASCQLELFANLRNAGRELAFCWLAAGG
jgi:hypothetical protein